MRQESQIVDLSAYVAETFQRLDVLVNNAGVIKVVGPEQMTEKDFYNEYDVTVKGVTVHGLGNNDGGACFEK